MVGLYNDRILRRLHVIVIEVVATLNLFYDRWKRRQERIMRSQALYQFCMAAASAFFHACCKINLEFRLWKDHCSDIASHHDDVAASRHCSLLRDQNGAYFGVGRDDGY